MLSSEMIKDDMFEYTCPSGREVTRKTRVLFGVRNQLRKNTWVEISVLKLAKKNLLGQLCITCIRF